MINTSKGDALTRAYELIEADKLDDAKAILKPILDTDKDNADAWWLYAHAVTDAETARIALNNVLRLDRDYPEAADLLKTLEQESPSEGTWGARREPSFLPAVPASLPDLPESGSALDDFDETDEFEDESEPFYRRQAFLIGVITIVLIVAIIFVVVHPFGNPTPANLGPTVQPTLSAPTLVESTQLISTPTLEAETVSFEGLRAAFGAYQLADNGINVKATTLGNTLLVSVCTTDGQPLRALLPQVMDTLAKAKDSYAAVLNSGDGVGVQMMDCQSNRVLLTIGVPLSVATDYANGSLSERDFEGQWKAIQ
jgi:hypothetical protein